MNKVIFRNHKCNPVKVIEQARNTYQHTLLYNKNTNFSNLVDAKGKKFKDVH